MRDGEIQNGRAWFGFDLQDLQWLQDLIPHGDDFRDDIEAAIGRLAGKQSTEDAEAR